MIKTKSAYPCHYGSGVLFDEKGNVHPDSPIKLDKQGVIMDEHYNERIEPFNDEFLDKKNKKELKELLESLKGSKANYLHELRGLTKSIKGIEKTILIKELQEELSLLKQETAQVNIKPAIQNPLNNILRNPPL